MSSEKQRLIERKDDSSGVEEDVDDYQPQQPQPQPQPQPEPKKSNLESKSEIPYDEIDIRSPEAIRASAKASSSPSKSGKMAKVRRRQSPPDSSPPPIESYYGAGSAEDRAASRSTKYGTLDTGNAGMKRSLLIDSDADGRDRVHITRKQFAIALVAFALFAGAVAVTLILGLPRLDAKRAEYFAAKFVESPIEAKTYQRNSIIVSGAGSASSRCADLANNSIFGANPRGSAIDAALVALLCSLLYAPQSIRFDSGISAMIYSPQNGRSFARAIQIPGNILDQDPNDTRQATEINPLMLIEAANYLHQKFGKISWSNVIRPVINLAENDDNNPDLAFIPVTAELASFIARQIHDSSSADGDTIDPLHRLFTKTTISNETENKSTKDNAKRRQPLQVGDRLSVAAILRTLRTISSVTNFSGPEIAQIFAQLNSDLFAQGLPENRKFASNDSSTTNSTFDAGKLRIPVIDDYRIESAQSLHLLNRSLALLTMQSTDPAAAATARTLAILQQVVAHDEARIEACVDDNRTLRNGALEFHYLIEALKFGLAPLYNPKNDTSTVIDKSAIRDVASRIVADAPGRAESGSPEPDYYGYPARTVDADDWPVKPRKLYEHSESIQITVYDGPTGDVVTLTTSAVNTDNRLAYSPSTGIIIEQNFASSSAALPIFPAIPVMILEDGDAPETKLPDPAKNPSTQSSSLGGVRLVAISTANDFAHRSIAALVQVLYKILFDCEDSKTATDESRLYYDPKPDRVRYERTFPQAYIDLLAKLFAHFGMKSIGDEHTAVSTIYRIDRASNSTETADNDNDNGDNKRNTTRTTSAPTTFRLLTMIDYRDSSDSFSAGN